MPILRAELEGLVAAGATFIQIDDPSPAIHPDAPSDFAALLNAAVEPVVGRVRLGAHLCFGNFLGRPLAAGRTGPCSTRCSGSGVDELVLEFANREMSEVAILGEIAAAGRDVAAGVIDVKNSHLESPDEVAERIDAVLAAGVPPDRLALVPDCGFSQTPAEPGGPEAAGPRRGPRPRPRPGRLTSRPAMHRPAMSRRDPSTVTARTDLGVVEAVAAIGTGALTATDVDGRLPRRGSPRPTPAPRPGSPSMPTARGRRRRERDADVAAGRPIGPLHGVPVGIKDIIDVAGLPTPRGRAAVRAHATPTPTPPLVARLRGGRARSSSARPTTTRVRLQRPGADAATRGRPRTPGRVVVGIRGRGRGAAGPGRRSARRPAARSCDRPRTAGWSGSRVRYGAVPLDGIVPLAPSLDHCGSFARSVAGRRARSGASWRIARCAPSRRRSPSRGSRWLGAARPSRPAAPRPPRRCHRPSRGAGAGVDAVELGFAIDAVVDAGRTVMAVEASRAHAPAFAQHADEYGPGIAGLIRAGQAVTPEALAEATRVRSGCRAAVGSLLDGIDALLSPVAFGVGAAARGRHRRLLALPAVELHRRAVAVDSDRARRGGPPVRGPADRRDHSGRHRPTRWRRRPGASGVARASRRRRSSAGQPQRRIAAARRFQRPRFAPATRGGVRRSLGGAVLSRMTSSVASSTRGCAGISPSRHPQDELGGGHRHLDERLADRRQRRPDPARDRQVVEADDAQVLRDVESQPRAPPGRRRAPGGRCRRRSPSAGRAGAGARGPSRCPRRRGTGRG